MSRLCQQVADGSGIGRSKVSRTFLTRRMMVVGRLVVALGALSLLSVSGAAASNTAPSLFAPGTPGSLPAGGGLNARAALAGHVVDALSGVPVASALVQAGLASVLSGPDGAYSLTLAPGRYDVRIEAAGYVGMTYPGETVTATGGAALDPALVRADLTPAERADLRARMRPPGSGETEGKVAPTMDALADETTAPATIRLLMTDGSIVTLQTDDYLKGVVPFEIGPGAPPEAQKAQAVAARTYAATRCLADSAGDPTKCEPGVDANVDTTTRTQVWRPSPRYDSSNQAVDATSGVVVRHNGRLASAALYFARAAGRTRNNEDVFNGPPYSYLRSVASPDPFLARYGHGVGMSQEGAMVLADWGASYADILRHYYTGLTVDYAPPPVAAHDRAPQPQVAPQSAPTMRTAVAKISGDAWTQGTAQGGTITAGKLEAAGGAVVYTTAPQAAGFEFQALAVQWAPDVPNGATIHVEMRVSKDGVTWGAWRDAPLLDGGRESETPDGTDLILEQGRAAQVRVALDQGTAKLPVALTELSVHFFRPEGVPSTTDVLAAAHAAKAASPDAARPAIVPRSAYGVSEVFVEWTDCSILGLSDRPGYMEPQAFAAHHTADNSTSLSGPAWVYLVWYYHTYTNGWGDVGYHYLVDRDGVVYQGRTPGTATPPYMVEAGHVRGYNCSSGGVVALGNYQPDIEEPLTQLTDATLQGLSRVLAWLMDDYGWRPRDLRTVKDITVYGLAGHRDFGGTACPGQDLYDRLPELRLRTEQLMDAEPPTTATATPSPTATGTPPAGGSATPTPRPIETRPATPVATPAIGAGCRDVLRQGDFTAADAWERSAEGAYMTGSSALSPPQGLFLGWNNAQADKPYTAQAIQRGISIPQPVERARLSFWYAPFSVGNDGDRHRVELQDATGATLPGGVVLDHQPPRNVRDWIYFEADVTNAVRAASGNMTLAFSVTNDGNGLKTYMRVDDVVLEVCGGATATPTRTPTPTPTRTPSPTPTPIPITCGAWDINGAFEDGDTAPTAWTLQEGFVNVGLADDNHTPGGARSLRLGRLAPADGMGFAAAWQELQWPAGVASARLRFAYRALGGDAGDRRLLEARDVVSGDREVLWALDGAQDTDWQIVEVPVTMRPDRHAFQVYFALLDRGGANAELRIDDVSLELCGRGLGGPLRVHLPGVWSGGQ